VVLCSVSDIRVYVNPRSISDLEISNIISRVKTEVHRKAKTTDESNSDITEAIIHGAVAVTLKKARSNGELAGSVESPESKISNTGIIEEIKTHEEDRDYYIQQYKDSVRYTNFIIPSGRMGYKTVNGDP
jgi:hypothetical protein